MIIYRINSEDQRCLLSQTLFSTDFIVQLHTVILVWFGPVITARPSAYIIITSQGYNELRYVHELSMRVRSWHDGRRLRSTRHGNGSRRAYGYYCGDPRDHWRSNDGCGSAYGNGNGPRNVSLLRIRTRNVRMCRPHLLLNA